MSQIIKIFDTTLRDGEQCPGASLNHEEKLKIAKQLEKLGVDIIEAGFPIASPDDFRAVHAIAKAAKKTTICGLARAVEKDIQTAFEAIRPARKKRIHTFLATSDLHLKFKLKMTRAEALAKIAEMVKFARLKCNDVEFSPEDASRSDPKFLWKALESAIKAGAKTLNIPDTVGYATPAEFGEFIKNIRKNTRGIRGMVISVHCHDDLGLAVANSLAAVRNGARQIECTVNGIGERAGNTSLEEIVMAIRTRKDVFRNLKTNVKAKEIYRTSRLVSSLTGFVVPPNKAIVGSNAFAHESGIHQHGILAKRETYEIMKAQDIGLDKNKLVLGKHSGRAALIARMIELGFELSQKEIEKTFRRFKLLADKKKEIFDEDLEALVLNEISEAAAEWIVDGVEVISGTKKKPRAEVILKRSDGKKFRKKSGGTGPVDAAYSAVNKIIGEKVKLLEFRMDAVSEGIDAQATVAVKVETADGRTYTGKGSHTDIVVASVRSYVNALNKILAGKERMKVVL
ncbi:2-isopropylmalate synthase [Candidatus Gracilibacteria bacterium]|nr:2-isopropylmalate synthase [Candidatus Gracilibacteria bacterium]